MIHNEWLDMDTPVYVDPDEPSPEHKVYVVRSESGEYSDHVTMVKGVFSTLEKAKAAIEGITRIAYHVKYTEPPNPLDHMGEYFTEGEYEEACDPRWSKDYFVVEDGLELVGTVEIHPTTKDGITYMEYMPDGRLYENWDAVTYFIDEYTMDKMR